MLAFCGDVFVFAAFLFLSRVVVADDNGLNDLLLSDGGINIGVGFSVRELLSVEDVSGVLGVKSGGGLLLGEGV